MKIFHVAGGGDRGGAKTHILALCSRLKERFDLTLVSLRSGDFPESAQQAGIKTATFFSWFVPYDYYQLIKLVRREKPDIVHCHGAYAHDLRGEISPGKENRHYRLKNYIERNCENYPTHELGPIAKVVKLLNVQV